MKRDPIITIVTPTYNRGDKLPELFRSLCSQTCKDFRWLCIDDGSTDNTHDIINSFKHHMSNNDCGFSVDYIHKENGGKHTALNLGVKKAKGELTLILDSDDELPADAISDILEAYRSIKGKQGFAGVCGYMAHRDERVIGHPFVEVDASEIELRYKYHIHGDMCEVFRTDVLREFPFPEIRDERFCPESLVWNRIARKYRLHVFPKVIYLRDYLDGGLTDNIVRIRMNSPIASMMTYAEMNALPIPWVQKTKAAINYYRFKACLSESHAKEANCGIPSLKAFWNWTKPFGTLMHILDIKR